MNKKQKPQTKKKAPEKKMVQSETVIIKRLQIHFAPYNPKRHTEDGINTQLRNFKSVGFLGGIVWNEKTGNLISGHKRIMAMDKYFNNTKEHPVNYNVKVEKVNLTEKQEKEQNIFMDARSTNTAQDYDLLAGILPEIDYKLAGLTSDEMNLISIESPMFDTIPKDEIKNDFKELSREYDRKKEAVKEAKRKIRNEIIIDQGEPAVTLVFDSYENKCAFMERFGFTNELRNIKGESFSDMIERIA